MQHDENLNTVYNQNFNVFFQWKNIFIFDMDWVIIDIEEINFKSYQLAIMEILNYDLSYKDYKDFFQWKKFSEWIKYFLNSIAVNDIEWFKEKLWDKIFIHKKFFLEKSDLQKYMSKTIVEFLSAIRKENYLIWLATSTIRDFTYTILNRIWITKFFDIIVTAEDVWQGKPSWEIYIKAFSLLGWKDHNKWVVFEDSIPWIQSAFNAWLYCVNINWTDEYYSLFWHNKNYIFWGNDFSFFIPFIKRWNM